MTANTGRTVGRWGDFIIGDSADTLRSIPVDTINDVGLDYEAMDQTALQDAIKNVLNGHPSCVINITGPYDTSPAVAVGAGLSGSHTILTGLNGTDIPRSLDVQPGIRHAWEAGEPQFGITKTATSGFTCREYKMNPTTGKYSAQFVVFGGVAPAWGTAAESGS